MRVLHSFAAPYCRCSLFVILGARFCGKPSRVVPVFAMPTLFSTGHVRRLRKSTATTRGFSFLNHYAWLTGAEIVLGLILRSVYWDLFFALTNVVVLSDKNAGLLLF